MARPPHSFVVDGRMIMMQITRHDEDDDADGANDDADDDEDVNHDDNNDYGGSDNDDDCNDARRPTPDAAISAILVIY